MEARFNLTFLNGIAQFLTMYSSVPLNEQVNKFYLPVN